MGFRSRQKAPLKARNVRGRSFAIVRPDLAARLRQIQPSLREQLGRRNVLAVFLKAVNATPEPDKVAESILVRFADWIPATAHAAIVAGDSALPALMAGRNVGEEFESALQKIAGWVMRHGELFATGNLAADRRIAASQAISVVAVPLAGRRPMGALIAFDDVSSAREPRLSASVEQAMAGLLEPAAVALETAMQLQQAEALSVTDDLTRLYNSRYLNQVLRRETKRASRSGRPLSLLFVDLDDFKGINDRYGHLAGSRALVETAQVLRESARETDVVARFGGDEFALVLPETHPAGALLVARRVRERIATHHFLEANGLNVHLTASVGVATMPDVASSDEQLMKSADEAMYRVKDRGKDGIEVAGAVAAGV